MPSRAPTCKEGDESISTPTSADSVDGLLQSQDFEGFAKSPASAQPEPAGIEERCHLGAVELRIELCNDPNGDRVAVSIKIFDGEPNKIGTFVPSETRPSVCELRSSLASEQVHHEENAAHEADLTRLTLTPKCGMSQGSVSTSDSSRPNEPPRSQESELGGQALAESAAADENSKSDGATHTTRLDEASAGDGSPGADPEVKSSPRADPPPADKRGSHTPESMQELIKLLDANQLHSASKGYTYEYAANYPGTNLLRAAYELYPLSDARAIGSKFGSLPADVMTRFKVVDLVYKVKLATILLQLGKVKYEFSGCAATDTELVGQYSSRLIRLVRTLLPVTKGGQDLPPDYQWPEFLRDYEKALAEVPVQYQDVYLPGSFLHSEEARAILFRFFQKLARADARRKARRIKEAELREQDRLFMGDTVRTKSYGPPPRKVKRSSKPSVNRSSARVAAKMNEPTPKGTARSPLLCTVDCRLSGAKMEGYDPAILLGPSRSSPTYGAKEAVKRVACCYQNVDGFICVRDFRQSLGDWIRRVGLNPTEAELSDIVKQMDIGIVEKDGMIGGAFRPNALDTLMQSVTFQSLCEASVKAELNKKRVPPRAGLRSAGSSVRPAMRVVQTSTPQSRNVANSRAGPTPQVSRRNPPPPSRASTRSSPPTEPKNGRSTTSTASTVRPNSRVRAALQPVVGCQALESAHNGDCFYDSVLTSAAEQGLPLDPTVDSVAGMRTAALRLIEKVPSDPALAEQWNVVAAALCTQLAASAHQNYEGDAQQFKTDAIQMTTCNAKVMDELKVRYSESITRGTEASFTDLHGSVMATYAQRMRRFGGRAWANGPEIWAVSHLTRTSLEVYDGTSGEIFHRVGDDAYPERKLKLLRSPGLSSHYRPLIPNTKVKPSPAPPPTTPTAAREMLPTVSSTLTVEGSHVRVALRLTRTAVSAATSATSMAMSSGSTREKNPNSSFYSSYSAAANPCRKGKQKMTEEECQRCIMQANAAQRAVEQQTRQAAKESCETISARLDKSNVKYPSPPRSRSSDGGSSKRYLIKASMAPKTSRHSSDVFVTVEARPHQTLKWVCDQAAEFFGIDLNKYYPLFEAQYHEPQKSCGETFAQTVLRLVFNRGGRGGARPENSAGGASSSSCSCETEETYPTPMEDNAAATTRTEAPSWAQSVTAASTTDDAAPMALSDEPASSSVVTAASTTDDAAPMASSDDPASGSVVQPDTKRCKQCIMPRCEFPRYEGHEFCGRRCADAWDELMQRPGEGVPKCALPTCERNAEPKGRLRDRVWHECCSRRHHKELMEQRAASGGAPPVVTAPEDNDESHSAVSSSSEEELEIVEEEIEETPSWVRTLS